ncbi:acetyltransferase [Lacinutrix neustonica]|uniref:Acetyltransferase n=1 Tax=Lacinutrix neustonica TaxID=2980107 RepID=A0A9E8SDB7_9FLAO|nr:acetyltransferase [Lacinutrix neustonica]WAC01926.1 acetyltransferase [Lacinutrix neustonica]
MKILGIIGCGDLGKQIANYAINDNHYNDVVFFDDYSKETSVNGFLIRGTIESIDNSFANKEFDELIIAIGYKHLKTKKVLYEKFVNRIPFGKIIHSTCYLDPTAKIGHGCVIYPKSVLDANVIIKENTLINISCIIAHDTQVGAHCFLSPCIAMAGFVTIKEQCVIGINATIIDNITIGKEIQIGGGAVVINTISKKGVYVGNPAKFIRE